MKKSITFAQLFITHKCQLRCKYCYEHFKDDRVMPLETAIKIIDYVLDNGVRENKKPTIAFFGGEPLLHFEDIIKPCVEHIENRNLGIDYELSLTTNGILLDEKVLQYLKEHKFNYMVSWDGIKESQDATRKLANGKSIFELLESKIDLILKYHPLATFRITSDPLNVKYLADSVMYFEEQGVQKLNIFPNVFTEWTDEAVAELSNQLDILNKHYIEVFNDYDIPLLSLEQKLMFYRRVAAEYCEEHNLYRTIGSCKPEKRCGFCYTGHGYFDVDGSMYTCAHVDFSPTEENQFYIGNINNTDEFNWDKVVRLLEVNRSEPLHSEYGCEKCPLNRICTGGCNPNNYIITGDINNVTPNYCKWMTTVYKKTSELIEHFDAEKENLLFRDYFFGAVLQKGGCYGEVV